MTENPKDKDEGPENGPLEHILFDIALAAQRGLGFAALTMTVALPDICVSLASEDGRSDSDRYMKWCEDNLGNEFVFLTPKDLWSMRCGALHNGRFGEMKHSVAKVFFALPGTVEFEDCRNDDSYVYSLRSFCGNFSKAVHNWYKLHKNDEIVKANTPKLMQQRKIGFGGMEIDVIG